MYVLFLANPLMFIYDKLQCKYGGVLMAELDNKNSSVQTDKVWTLPFIMIFLNSVVSTSTQWAVTPLLSSYAIELGADLKTASVVASIMSITAMFLRPVAGYVVDRVNRKRLVMCASAANVVLAILHIFANDIKSLSVCRFLQGLVFAFTGVSQTALSTSFLPMSRLGEGMGWMALANVISQSIGPSIGLFLIEKFGYYACFIFCACACAVSVLIISFLPYKYVPRTVEHEKFSLGNIISWWVLPYAMICGLFSSCNGLDNTFITLLGKERGIEGFSLFFTAYSIVMFMARPISGKLLDKYGLKYMIYPALCCTAFSAFLTGSAQSMAVMILAGMFKGLGQSSGSPSIQATCLKKLGKDKAGIVSSTCYIGQDIGNSLAPILGGIVATNWGYKAVYWGYAVILVVGGSLIYNLKTAYEKRHETEEAVQQ